MRGTFCVSDVLIVTPTALEKVRSGDVIIFSPSDHKGDHSVIAHRVIGRTSDGLITGGDACGFPDRVLIHGEHLIGRVVQVQRGNRKRLVWGGFAGRLWACYVRFQRQVLALGRVPYRWLRASNLARHLWRPPLARVTLATEQGPVVKYLCGGKTVAVWQPETRAYWCRKPYDLVLDALTTNGPQINE